MNNNFMPWWHSLASLNGNAADRLEAKFFASVALMIFLFLDHTHAQQSIVHNVNFPQGNATWSIKFDSEKLERDTRNQQDSKIPSPQQITALVIEQDGSLRYDRISYGEKTMERWWIKDPPFVLWDGEGGRIHVSKSGNMRYERYDASFFNWVNAGRFKGLVDFKEVSCRFYEFETVEDQESKRYRAWINNETGRPVGWSNSGKIALFTFNDLAAPADLVLPARFQERLSGLMRFFAPPQKTSAR